MRLPGGGQMAFKTLLKRLYEEYDNDGLADSAAALSYYFIFAVFPLLFCIATLAAFAPFAANWLWTFLDRVRPLVPGDAMSVVDQQAHALVSRTHPKLLTLGLLTALYGASRGVDAVRKALNLAYDVKESRPVWKTEMIAFGMTIGGAVLVLMGIAALVAGGGAGFWLAKHVGIADVYVFAWKWLRWPITAALIMLAAALAYFLLPDVKQQFKYITPGSVVGTLLWLLATWAFGEYVAHFANYSVTYGSIGGMIILLTWFYIAGFLFLIGGELNAILEHASVSGKSPGARAEGDAAPPPGERPSAMPVGASDKAKVAEKSHVPAPTTGAPT
ncbi:MAG TPA: YihY/virulence factor BrkB family protein [Polyangia bacterium]|jgi:membrane protein|nr:YihY/virulence factor BrkB family protein [Polyangia bacterium]